MTIKISHWTLKKAAKSVKKLRKTSIKRSILKVKRISIIRRIRRVNKKSKRKNPRNIKKTKVNAKEGQILHNDEKIRFSIIILLLKKVIHFQNTRIYLIHFILIF